MKKELSTREWILFTIIISIIQGFIWYASFVNANNSSALNYVSFAGTLISIILAVLAIGYTYGESIVQKNQSETISSQIQTLNDVVKNVEIQSSNLDKISEINDELLHLSSEFKEGFSNTHKKVDDVKNSIEKIITENFNNSVHKVNVPNSIDKSTLSKLLISARSPLLEITLLAIYSSKSRKFGISIDLNDYLYKATKIADSKGLDYSDYGDLEQLFTGSTLILYSALEGLELLKSESEKIILDENLIHEIKNTVIPNLRETGEFYTILRDEILKTIK